MKFLILLAALAVCVQSQTDDLAYNEPNVCGKRLDDFSGVKSQPTKVVGGIEATPKDWNWQIQLNSNGRFICGGSLVTRRFVITAAHCVSATATPTTYSVVLGHHSRSIPESWAITRRVTATRNHQSYNSATYKNDISLLRLETPVTYTDEVGPVCLDDGSEDFFNRRDAYVTGWGSTASGGSVVDKLRQLQLPIVNDTYCKTAQYGNSHDPATMVCAAEMGDGKDTCQGDSGGPLVAKRNIAFIQGGWTLVGITSWGYGCGNIGVYAKVATYASKPNGADSWVETNMKQLLALP